MKPTLLPTSKPWATSRQELTEVKEIASEVAASFGKKCSIFTIDGSNKHEHHFCKVKSDLGDFAFVVVFAPTAVAISANHKRWKSLPIKFSVSLKKLGVDPLAVESNELTRIVGIKTFVREETSKDAKRFLTGKYFREMVAEINPMNLVSFQFTGLQLLTEYKFCSAKDALRFTSLSARTVTGQ